MKRLSTLSLFCIISNFVLSQQLPLLTQYREYHGYINPASIGVDYFIFGQPERLIKFGGGQRLQWVGNENFTVTTSILNAEGFINLGGVSLLGGFNYLHDHVDVTTMDGFYVRGAVYVGDPRNSFWGGIGFNVGYTLHSIDLRKLKFYEEERQLDYIKLTASTPDLGVGSFGIYQWNNYDRAILFGVSVPQILEYKVAFTDDSAYDYIRLRHLFTQLSYFTIVPSTDDFGYLEFSLWGKLVKGLPPNIDFNVKYQISSPAWIGGGASTNGTVHLEAGTNFRIGNSNRNDKSQNFLRIGYGLDFPLNSGYSTYFGSSHEINLAFIVN